MVFSSVVFLLYFLPLVLALYFICPNRLKNYFLLLASILFYSWGAPVFIFVILGTTALDFFLVKWMDRQIIKKKKILILVLSLCMNIGLLFYFKYFNFFIGNFNSLLHLFHARPMKALEVFLPIGISFYTFESLTYVIDVYRGDHKPLNNFLHYQLYIILFPKLIAGPIIRYRQIADQMTGRFAEYSTDQVLNGFYRFVIGLGKKVIIANTIGSVADEIFSLALVDIGTATAWIGMLSYTFQIYFDFSGYSDMAIGIGHMLGFRFPENFDNPYTSKSITEFWRRWHMTLGAWMKNYLYIPLGGNKVNSKRRLYFNLWLVFILSGLWHGASWNFIVWGIFHGTFLVLERIGWQKTLNKLGAIPAMLITFLTVSVGWIFFRTSSLSYSFHFIKRLFGSPGVKNLIVYTNDFKIAFFLALVCAFFISVPGFKKIQDHLYFRYHSLLTNLVYTILALFFLGVSVSLITTTNFNPFIYFRF